jgi:DNA primase small subunit
MRPATLEFVKQRFTEYYRTRTLTRIPSLEQRECGFIFFDAASDVRMRRHMAFADEQELAAYVRNMAPAHVYYSAAYYHRPAAPTMNDKHWAGADLIFDLDADHIVRGVPYAEMLERVKEETLKLIDMLTEELGFSPQRMALTFSGGRGYHIHVRDIAVREWGSQERREVVDYVCGIGIDPSAMLGGVQTAHRGWQQRYFGAISDHLRWLSSLDAAEATTYLSGIEGVGKRAAAEFLAGVDGFLQALQENRTDELHRNKTLLAVLSASGTDFENRVRGAGAHADEPVTTDIKRLIRMPGSLHGGSGMRVVPLDLRELPAFEPLVDAVIFGDREVKVEMKANITTSMLGNTYILKKGTMTVPEALAVFVCCRNLAELAGGV